MEIKPEHKEYLESKKLTFEQDCGLYSIWRYKDIKILCHKDSYSDGYLYRFKGSKYFLTLEGLFCYYVEKYSKEIKAREKAIENYKDFLQNFYEMAGSV